MNHDKDIVLLLQIVLPSLKSLPPQILFFKVVTTPAAH